MKATYARHGRGMSQRAESAYDDGRKPLSKITAADLKAAGWKESKALAVYLAKEAGFWRPGEWHHTGLYASKSDFYDPDSLVFDWEELSASERAEYRDAHQAWKVAGKTAAPVPSRRVEGTYTYFYGRGRRVRAQEIAFTGTLTGRWILTDDGEKKASEGKHISYTMVK